MQKRVFGGVKKTQADGHAAECSLASESGVLSKILPSAGPQYYVPQTRPDSTLAIYHLQFREQLLQINILRA